MKGFGKKRRASTVGVKMGIPKKIKGVVKGIREITKLVNKAGSSKLGKNGVQVIFFTLVFTLAAVGLVGLINGQNTGSDERLGFYVLFSSVVFIVTIYSIEKTKRKNAMDIMKVVIAITIFGFVLVSLSGEGLVRIVQGTGYTLQTYLYLVTGGLLCSGVGWWVIRHWKEYT